MGFANITPTAGSDGAIYASAVPLTTTEATLGGGASAQTPDPIPTEFGQGIVAVVQLSVNGYVAANNSYVVMQMDLGDGVWADLNWVVWTASQGSATFVMSNGIAGANTFQQSRQSGQVPNPQVSGGNQMCLGGRIRFVGRTAQASGGSSSLFGVTAGVIATIRYKLLGLR